MYVHLFLAGTFDGLHQGHQALLTKAMGSAKNVTIGLTTDAFVERFKGQKGSSFDERKKALGTWLDGRGWTGKATIIPIGDPHEPAASMADLDSLVVTQENRHRGEEINAKRVARGLRPLDLLDVPLVLAEDGSVISSTRVRAGEIDREGALLMPETLRALLGLPLGQVLVGQAIARSIRRYQGEHIVTVGDMTTKTVLDVGVVPNLSIIDLHVERKPFLPLVEFGFPKTVETVFLQSGPGYISQEALTAIDAWSKQSEHMVMVVSGEEDLLALPVLIHAPIGAVVYYGQPARNAAQSVAGGPGKGIVEVLLTPERKEHAIALLRKFV